MENNKKKYYIAKSKKHAMALSYLSKQEPYIYPNKFENDKQVWSFIWDSNFDRVLKIVEELINRK